MTISFLVELRLVNRYLLSLHEGQVIEKWRRVSFINPSCAILHFSKTADLPFSVMLVAVMLEGGTRGPKTDAIRHKT